MAVPASCLRQPGGRFLVRKKSALPADGARPSGGESAAAVSRWHAHRSAASPSRPSTCIPKKLLLARVASISIRSPSPRVGQGLDGRRRWARAGAGVRGEAEEREETMRLGVVAARVGEEEEEASHGDGGAWRRLALGRLAPPADGARPSSGESAAAVSRWPARQSTASPSRPSTSACGELHEDTRRSAMANSLGRIVAVEGGDHVCRVVAALIRPSSHHQRRRAAFLPRPSHLSAMSVAAAASSREGGAAADEAERRHSPSAVASRGRRTWRRGDAGAGGGISPAGRAPPLPMHLPLSPGRRRSSSQPAPASPLFFSPAGRRPPAAGPLLLSHLSIVVAASPVIAPPDKEQSERKRGKERRGKER
uniref:Uncharacterized protein n=1 Tax=Oryza nivara TaxID=4536 RepID=A0A0E0GNR7_ORYNI